MQKRRKEIEYSVNFFGNLGKKNEKGQFLNRVYAGSIANPNASTGKRRGGGKSLTGTVITQRVKKALKESILRIIEDTKLRERIGQIDMNIEETENNPEEYLIEDMLNMHFKEKDFDAFHFSDSEALKQFQTDSCHISDFLMIQNGQKDGKTNK